MNLRNVLLALGIMSAGSIGLWAQEMPPAVTVSGLDNQIYVGYLYTRFDYEIAQQQGAAPEVLTASGASVQYNYRNRDHLTLTGMVNYGSGSLAGQKLVTAAAGGGFVQPIWRLEPYIQVLAGASRLSSTDDLYLSSGSSTGFTYLFQGGVDLTLRGHWGVRAISVESQYLSFGPKGSNYRSIGAGVLYRFGSKGIGPHRNGR